MIVAARCPGVALFTAGTRRVNPVGSSRALIFASHLHSSRPASALLCPSLISKSSSSSTSRRSFKVSASSDAISYSADDLSSNNNGSKALVYKALAVALAATGITLLVAPTRTLQSAFAASPTTLISGLTQALGSVHILAAIAANCLSDAASHARLSSETYKRLNFGLAVWGAATLAAYYKVSTLAPKAAVIFAPNAQIAFYTLFTAATLLPVLLSGKAGIFAPLPPAPRMRPLFTARRLYSLAATAAAIFAVSVGYNVYSPGALSVSWLVAPLGALGSTLVNFLGCGALLAHQVLVTLEDAARRDRLGASTFRALNWGVALVSGTIIALAETGVKAKLIKLWPAFPQTAAEFSARWPDVFSEFALGITVILGCFSLYFAIAAKKK